MGCDVHMFTEIYAMRELYNLPIDEDKLRNDNINEILSDNIPVEKWVSADKWVCEVDDYEDVESKYWDTTDRYYRGRNYYLFGILAGVRDYGKNVNQIAPLRGVPDDASDAYKMIVDQWDGDGHSHSYYTLEELLNVKWDSYETSYIKDFLECIEKLKKLGEPSKVRLLFFFDN